MRLFLFFCVPHGHLKQNQLSSLSLSAKLSGLKKWEYKHRRNKKNQGSRKMAKNYFVNRARRELASGLRDD